MRLWTRGGAARGGVRLLTRPQAAQGQVNWPKCMLCMRAVDAYGLENETDSKIELWARCDGVRIDPSTGTVVHGAPKVHETRKDSMVIMKTPDWSQNRLADIISRSAFFAPDGDRKWEQDFTADGVHAS